MSECAYLYVCMGECEWTWAGMCLLAFVSKWGLLYVSFQNVFLSDIKGTDKDGKKEEGSVKKEKKEGATQS